MALDYRKLDAQAEELRTAGAELAAKGDGITPEERDSLMKITGQLNQLDELRVTARDDALEEARHIAEHGNTIGGGPGGQEKADADVADAYRSWIRNGSEESRAALVSLTDANGGYVVPEPIHGPLIQKYRNVSPLVERCANFTLSGDSKMYLPYKATHAPVANATETGARAEQTEPTFQNIVLNAGEYYTDQRASQMFLDSDVGGEEMMLGWIYEDFAVQLNADIAVGAGTNNTPAGLFKASGTYTTMLSGSAGAVVNTNFPTLFFALPQKYRPNSAWYMSPATLAVLMGFAYPNLNNTPLVQPNTTDGTFSILGKRVVEVDDAPAVGAANYPVAFGDLSKGYAVGIHKVLSILRDPYTVAPYVRFYGVARMGGIPWDPSAVQLLKSNNA